MTICLRMTAYSTSERKTRSMQARSQTSRAVTVLETGIRVVVELNMLIRTRHKVTNKTILAGTTSYKYKILVKIRY